MYYSTLYDELMTLEPTVGTQGVMDYYGKFKEIADVLRTLGISKGQIMSRFWLILDRIDKNKGDLLLGVNAVLDIFGLPPLDALPEVSASALAEAQAFRPLRSLILKRLHARLEAEGHKAEDIDKAFAIFEAESDRPFLDWLMNGGFEKLLEMILKIIALF